MTGVKEPAGQPPPAPAGPLSIGDLAALLGRERWRVRAAVDIVTGGRCPRVGRYRSVPPGLVAKVKALLEEQDRQNGKVPR